MNSNHERALRAIAAGARTPPKVRTATNTIAWPVMKAAIDDLVEMGHVSRGRGSVLTLTSSGRALIAPPPLPAMRPYVPPKPVVTRVGADDWRRVPSVVAGQRVDRDAA